MDNISPEHFVSGKADRGIGISAEFPMKTDQFPMNLTGGGERGLPWFSAVGDHGLTTQIVVSCNPEHYLTDAVLGPSASEPYILENGA